MAGGNYNLSASKEWQKRNTLAIVGFFGLALMYSLRFNLSIGIVAMVDHEDNEVFSKDFGNSTTYSNWTTSNTKSGQHKENICPALIHPSSLLANDSSSSWNSSISHAATAGIGIRKQASSQGYNDNFTKFKWSEKDQGLVLGSFFWGYILTQIPGGLIAQKYGGKWIISVGLLCTGVLAMVLPWAAYYGGMAGVVAIRVLQGVCEGVIIPAFAVLLAKWTPPSERAGLATMCFSGMPFGTALTMIISGHLISSFGWPAVFFAPGIATIFWFVAWTYFVYSSPKEHPTISKNELSYIETSIQDQHGNDEGHNASLSEIPWREIICSMPVWAILLSHFANTWGHNTLKAEGPKYLHSVLHFDIHSNAYIAALPYICQWLFCNLVTRLSDYLIAKEVLSLSAARRLCNSIGQGGTALAYLCLILADCNRTLAIICFMMCGSLNGAIYGGFLINPIDISPNYAGVLEGLVNGISNIAGFGAPYVAGLILNSEPTMYGWRYVFLIPVIGDFLGNLCFVLFCSTEIQPWNSKKRKDVEETQNNNLNS